MHHIRPGIKERWQKIPEDKRALVLMALTRKEQAVVMQAIGGAVPEDQHVFDFPGVGKLIATKEMGDLLRIDFVPDLETPECSETLRWPAEPSLIATVALHHMLAETRSPDDESYEVGPAVFIEDGTGGDVAAYAYIPTPGHVEITADLLGPVLRVLGGTARRLNSAGTFMKKD